MSDPFGLLLPLTLITCFLGGLIIGYAYFRALRETVLLIVNRGHPLLGAALALARMALLGAAFYVAVLAGALALLSALAGVLCAKALMLRQVARSDA